MPEFYGNRFLQIAPWLPDKSLSHLPEDRCESNVKTQRWIPRRNGFLRFPETSLLSVSAESCSRNNELDRAALGREREEGSTRRPFVLVSNGPGFPYTQKPARRVSDRRESRE